MAEDRSVKRWFGENLAEILSDKIKNVYCDFDKKSYITDIASKYENLEYSKRVELHADVLKNHLPKDYNESIKILMKILGEENPCETGMFSNYYWILPISKFVEKYGLNNFETSVKAIEEITKRSTGEFVVRAYINKYPDEMIKIMYEWSKSGNFHLRRLASEGLRPKLPWAKKLDLFIDKPDPVFNILENLLEDDVKYVKKSVANHLTDYLKVNKIRAEEFIKKHQKSNNLNTKWIIKRATRKISVD